MSLSSRVSIQWPPGAPEEETDTLVMSTPGGHYVDVRVFKQNANSDVPFEKVFDWVLTGDRVPLEGNKVEFTHEIDSKQVSESIRRKVPLDKIPSESDIGEFGTFSGQDKIETGRMRNQASGKVQDYIEKWRPLSPTLHTPVKEYGEQHNERPPYCVLRVSTSDFEGKIIQLGNWIQGVLYDKHTQKLSVTRKHYDKQWRPLISYGDDLFPRTDVPLNEVVVVENVEWHCIEKK